jgi:hypothetical protein
VPARHEPSDPALRLSLPLGGKVLLRAFPHDAHFFRDIRRAALAVQSSASTEQQLLELLQSALRAWYPRLEIRPREDLAAIAQGDPLWYVMRDGRVGQGREDADRLYAVLSDARATTDEASLAVARAEAAVIFASQPRSRRARERTAAAQGDDGAAPDDT